MSLENEKDIVGCSAFVTFILMISAALVFLLMDVNIFLAIILTVVIVFLASVFFKILKLSSKYNKIQKENEKLRRGVAIIYTENCVLKKKLEKFKK